MFSCPGRLVRGFQFRGVSLLASGFWQVAGLWEWSVFLRDKAASHGRDVVFVNLDESPIPQDFKTGRGFCLPKSQWPLGKLPSGSRKGPRGTATLIAMTCSEPSWQERLPQILLGNHRVFPRRHLTRVQAEAPATVRYWRAKSSWVNAKTMVRILQELSDTIGVCRTEQVVIVMDCSRVHLTEEVIRMCQRLYYWILYVPTHTTPLLQPLDAAVFGPLKQQLRRQVRVLKEGNQDQDVFVQRWMTLIGTVAADMLSRRTWARSFHSVGIAGSGCNLSADLQQLGLRYPQTPAAPDLSLLLPKGYESMHALLLSCRRKRLRLS